ncbi:unnamed protein product [Lactuca virosa]|uniref:Uncharacterized protein n=1 Tax=Lactuca virosa TaxID=75947 RepID=A0AAU9NEH2_9ASTR|nr:unnamed protein product [Lactuca virosa]
MIEVKVKVPDVAVNETIDEVNETVGEVKKIVAEVNELEAGGNKLEPEGNKTEVNDLQSEGNKAEVNEFEGMIRDMVECGYPQAEIELTMQKVRRERHKMRVVSLLKRSKTFERTIKINLSKSEPVSFSEKKRPYMKDKILCSD